MGILTAKIANQYFIDTFKVHESEMLAKIKHVLIKLYY